MPQKTNIKLDTYPELVKEWHPRKNGDKNPEDYAQFSSKKVWWKCPKGSDHEWETAVSYRTKTNHNCPFCAGYKLSITNRFDLNEEALLKEWNFNKNDLKPSEITNGTNKKVWWICKEGHEWESRLVDRVQRGYGCATCGYKKSSFENKGDWILNNKNLADEWNFEKNYLIGNPTDFKGTSSKKVWWKCPKGSDHQWEAEIRKRYKSNTGCPFCTGKKVSASNSFAVLYPKIAREWHPRKNGDKNPEDYAQFSSKKVWWKCPKGSDHEFQTTIGQRTRENRGCPYCSGHKLSLTNRLDIVAPEIAEQFSDKLNSPKKASDFTTGSNTKVWWKCKNPDHRPWKAPVASRIRQSIGCYICNQEERFANESRLFDIVKDLYPDHKVERAIRPKWLEGLEIDIFVPSLNLAIEYQGRQHYESIDFFGGKKAFEKRQILDEKKRKLLKEHNINLLEWKYTIEMTKQRVKKEINKTI